MPEWGPTKTRTPVTPSSLMMEGAGGDGGDLTHESHVVVLREPRHLTIRRGDTELAPDERAVVGQLPVPDADAV